MPTLSASQLIDWSACLLQAARVPPNEAAVVSRSLVESNLCGHDSHGVIRLPQYLDFLARGLYQTGAELKVERETHALLACDAQWGFGQVQAHRLVELLIPRAQGLGLSAGTLRHCGHVGRLGEYAERAVERGLILLATVNNDGAGQRVAPPGGTEPRLGTNPLCIGVPTDERPIILDFGTSMVAEGKVRAYYLDGKRPVPEGWLLDARGHPTRDPSVLYEPPLGSIVPMDGASGYKGFGLALTLDVLAGALAGGHPAYAGAPPAHGNCALFVVLDPERFHGRDFLTHAATSVCQYIRSTPRAEGVERIILPGDPERATRAQRQRSGIPLPEGHWQRLVEQSARLGVEVPPTGEECHQPGREQ